MPVAAAMPEITCLMCSTRKPKDQFALGNFSRCKACTRMRRALKDQAELQGEDTVKRVKRTLRNRDDAQSLLQAFCQETNANLRLKNSHWPYFNFEAFFQQQEPQEAHAERRWRRWRRGVLQAATEAFDLDGGDDSGGDDSGPNDSPQHRRRLK